MLLWIGTSLGGQYIAEIWSGTKIEQRVENLPLDGSTVYVRFFARQMGMLGLKMGDSSEDSHCYMVLIYV